MILYKVYRVCILLSIYKLDAKYKKCMHSPWGRVHSLHVILLSALLPCPCEAYPEAACFWNTLKSPKTWCIRYSLRLRPVLLHHSRTVHRIDPDAVHYNGSYNGTAFPSPWSHQHQPGSQNHKQEKRSRPYFFHCRDFYSLSSKIVSPFICNRSSALQACISTDRRN